MSNKCYIEFEGFEEAIQRLTKLEGNAKATAEKALKETHRIITKKAEESAQKPNLPAKGKYSGGDTSESLYREGDVEWAGTLASVKTGFSISKGGLASIFMIYGTPRHMKNQKMYNAFWSKKTIDEVREKQAEIFFDEIRKLGG
jgi:hypothetical protein